jgi:flagellar basal-body rod modification protein FlgD
MLGLIEFPMSNPIDPVGSNSAAATATATQAASRIPVRTLGQDDFLKLLVAQLNAQDPMNPQRDTEFVAQMAQFSALEQTRTMQSDIAGLRSEQQILQANGLIGRTVALQGADGSVVTGVVNGLRLEKGAPRIVVNGETYALGQMLGVTVPPNPT